MRCFYIICLLIVFGCNNTTTQKNKPELKSVAEANLKTEAVEVTIKGMTCTGCEQTIQSGITSIKGVKQVKATFKNGKAYVEFIPGMADTIQMKEMITASGYSVAGFKLIPLDSLRSKL